MNVTKKSIALAVGGALVLSLESVAIAGTDNPFEIKTLSNGYQVADNHARGDKSKCNHDKKAKDGKCGEGKCGGDKAKDGKCGEGKCSGDKAKDGKCGEGKCGN